MSREREEKIIKQLKQMPKIKDTQDKQLLYAKIERSTSGRRADRNRKQKRFNWFVPSLATLATAILLVFIVQTGMFNQNESADYNSAQEISDRSLYQSDDRESFTDSDDAHEDYIRDDEEEAIESDLEDLDDIDLDTPVSNSKDSLVYYNDQHNLPMYTIAVADLQNMYAIPISLVDTAAENPIYADDVYNRIASFVNEEAYGVRHFPFDEVEFIFSNNNQSITMSVADDYQFPDSSSQASMFAQMINYMFADFPATELNLRTESNDSIDLGPFGEQSTVELSPLENLAYKVYQFENKERLLVPIEQNIAGDLFYTVDEALLEMQYDQDEFSIEGAIPEDAVFTIDPSDQELLRMNFEANPLFGDNNLTREMVEAILMTAKSFGYDEVAITIANDVNRIDQFDLSKPIPVPDGVNPIYLD